MITKAGPPQVPQLVKFCAVAAKNTLVVQQNFQCARGVTQHAIILNANMDNWDV